MELPTPSFSSAPYLIITIHLNQGIICSMPLVRCGVEELGSLLGS